LIEAPSAWRAVQAALALGLIVLCDYYYTLFCVLAGGILLVWNLPVLQRRHIVPSAVFLGGSLVCVGPFVATLLWVHARDPLVGAHPVEMFSTDLPSLLIPGGHWFFHRITQGYWSRLPGNIDEHSVYLGITALVLACYSLVRPGVTRPRPRSPLQWVWVAGVFIVLSLGPSLRAFGTPITDPILPYAWLSDVFPPLRLAGVPVRMMVMAILATALLAGVGLARLWNVPSRGRIVCGLVLIVVMVVELWPKGLAFTLTGHPRWVSALRELPQAGGVLIDLPTSETMLLYFQTIHEKPQALGYVSRAPQSVVARNDQLLSLYENGQYALLRDLGFSVVVTHPERSLPLGRAYADDDVVIYDLGASQ
jgi:hypothetical protein